MRTAVRVIVFSGGRGAATILRAMAQHPQLELTSLVNAYDDGLSTGRLRAFIPGMLGPSDIRKNITTLMPRSERCQRALATFLEYRLPAATTRDMATEILTHISRRTGGNCSDPILSAAYRDLSTCQSDALAHYSNLFLNDENRKFGEGRLFDFSDCSVGNLLFCGCYLDCEKNFNRATREFSALCEVPGRVLNVTDGTNYVLAALKEDGAFLRNETAIVSPQEPGFIKEIFLLDGYLSQADEQALSGLDLAAKAGLLRSRARIPRPNPEALKAIQEADLIIYGPGTQHSSLYPSYITSGLGEALAANRTAEKIFIANIAHDYDISADTVQTLLGKFLQYASRNGAIELTASELVTRVFVQEPDTSDVNRVANADYVRLDPGGLPSEIVVRKNDWESGIGKHAGGQILDELLTSVKHMLSFRVQPHRHLVSIVVPVLNEIRTLGRVLDSLQELSFPYPDLQKEIIVIDGGSTDGSAAVAAERKFVRLFGLGKTAGRGAAIRLGIEKARGNIVAIFPADEEYEAQDLASVISPIMENRYLAVFGSRAIKCINQDRNIRHIYGSDRVGFLMSKYGGMLLSIASLFLYNRYVTDPLSTLKAFDAELLRALRLSSSGVDLETEIIAKLALQEQFILEVPVRFSPRTKANGKKTTWRDGLSALVRLFRPRWQPAARDGGQERAQVGGKQLDATVSRH